jgi:hypothetical protein
LALWDCVSLWEKVSARLWEFASLWEIVSALLWGCALLWVKVLVGRMAGHWLERRQ